MRYAPGGVLSVCRRQQLLTEAELIVQPLRDLLAEKVRQVDGGGARKAQQNELAPAPAPMARGWMATLILNLILASAVAVYAQSLPIPWHQYSRYILISFHGTALVEEHYDNGWPHYRLRGDVCGPAPDYSGCFP